MVGPDREELRARIREPEHGQTLSFEAESIGDPLLIVEHRFRVKRFPTSSASNLADGVIGLRQRLESPLPLLVTTADNALHHGEIMTHFIERSLASEADISIGVTREKTVRSAFPDDEIGFFRFREGGYSFCNLFMICSERAMDAAEVFRTGGQFRKRPWRMLGAFGVINLLLYRLRLTTLRACLHRVGRNFWVAMVPVDVPWPHAPIDVGDPESLAFCDRLFKQ